MMLTMLLPCFTVVGSIAALHCAWWAVGDLVLEHVGIPFLDSGVPMRAAKRRAIAARHHALVTERARRSWSA